jgi:alpha-beta hydrolase superfamily lysophospholipase
MALPEVAEGFHSLGFNVLFYDARSVGGSGGHPRNLIDPLQMAEDLSGEQTPCLSTLKGPQQVKLAVTAMT